MALGIHEIGSNLLLQGYIDMDNNSLILGLSDQAYIQTGISDSSLDIANDAGLINIQALSEILLNAPETIVSDTLVIDTIPTLDNLADNILVIQPSGTVARRSVLSLPGTVSVDGITIDYNTAGELEVISTPSGTTGRSWSWAAGSNNAVTNSYLKSPGDAFTNQSTYLIAFDSTLTALSVMTPNSETWIAELRVNGVAVASINLSATTEGYVDGLSIALNAGDKIGFYCNGTNISKPTMSAWFEE